MHCRTAAALACLTVLAATGADACGFAVDACRSGVVVWPAYTVTGHRLGAVEAPVQRLPRLEPSIVTGQPLTVIDNNPTSVPGAIDPEVALVPLPRVSHRRTQAVYPVGY